MIENAIRVSSDGISPYLPCAFYIYLYSKEIETELLTQHDLIAGIVLSAIAATIIEEYSSTLQNEQIDNIIDRHTFVKVRYTFLLSIAAMTWSICILYAIFYTVYQPQTEPVLVLLLAMSIYIIAIISNMFAEKVNENWSDKEVKRL